MRSFLQRVGRAGRVFRMPAHVLTSLEHFFGPSVHAVKVIEHSRYARAHGGMTATTRPNLILVSISGTAFIADAELLLHEYFHVIRQWNTGRLSRSRYLVESLRRGYRDNRFEIEARRFASSAQHELKTLLRSRQAAPASGDPPAPLQSP